MTAARAKPIDPPEFDFSASLLTIRDARIDPFRRLHPGARLQGGFQFPPGTPDRFLDLNWARGQQKPCLSKAPLEQGRFLYAGLFDPHFGHFMVECIHRLWAWATSETAYDGLVFAATPRYRPDRDLPSFVTQTLAWFGIPADRVLFLVEPHRFACLDIPEAGKHRARPPSLNYLRLLADVLRLPEPSCDGTLLYVSRCRLPLNKGRFLAESILEECLVHHGFEVLHPENLSLEEQVARYRGASEIIIAGGSAVHGMEIIPSLTARVAVINRGHRNIGAVSLDKRTPDHVFMNTVDWSDGFSRKNFHVSTINPDNLIKSLGSWLKRSIAFSHFERRRFYDCEFADFLEWFRFDADSALKTLDYTEAKAQYILRGYSRHLARQGEFSPIRRDQLRRLALFYGDGTGLDP